MSHVGGEGGPKHGRRAGTGSRYGGETASQADSKSGIGQNGLTRPQTQNYAIFLQDGADKNPPQPDLALGAQISMPS